MNHNIFSLDINADINGSSPQLESQPKLSYFDVISNRLDAWQVKQQAIQESKSQIKKSFLLTDEDPLNGEVKTYKLTVELLQTSKAAQELPELSTWESGVDYAN